MKNDKGLLKVAVIHPEVEHSEFKKNSDRLLQLNRIASCNGAKIIVNTEMALSGYSFQSRNELEELTLSSCSETYKMFSELSKEFGNYICLGAAVKDENSDIIYNSAIVFGPEGEAVLKYNKINGEYRWACCGDASQDNTFETEWGTVGVLICSDSYFSLLARATALRGARMILVPANWPDMGMNPVEVWRARAIENGFNLLSANRAGVDKTMTFENAYSTIIDYNGSYLVNKSSDSSSIHYSEIELENGLISHDPHMMAHRNPSDYNNIYLNLKSLSSVQEHFELPEPGEVTVYSCSFVPVEKDMEELKLSIGNSEDSRILILPESSYDLKEMEELSRETSCGLIFRNYGKDGSSLYVFDSGNRIEVNEDDPELICSNAKIAILNPTDLYHPERFYHFSKSGCDICIVSAFEKFKNIEVLSGIRSIENTAVAVAFHDYASVSTPPSGHAKWEQDESTGRGYAMTTVHTGDLRKKRLYHDYDYEILLNKEN